MYKSPQVFRHKSASHVGIYIAYYYIKVTRPPYHGFAVVLLLLSAVHIRYIYDLYRIQGVIFATNSVDIQFLPLPPALHNYYPSDK